MTGGFQRRFGRLKGRLTRLLIMLSAKSLARDLYRSILGRDAKTEELSTAVSIIKRKGQVQPLAERLLESNEYQQKNIVDVADRLVTSSYEVILRREPDPAGYKSCMDHLLKDHDIGSVLRSMIESEEFAMSMESRVEIATAKRTLKGRLIVVSANCQTGGFCAALQGCLPDDTVCPLPMPELSSPEAECMEMMACADVIITGGSGKTFLRKHPEITGRSSLLHLNIPDVTFPAFHPDICYTRTMADGKLTQPHYNSGIGFWAYYKGLDIRDTAKLFNRESYAGLGYFNYWKPSLSVLRSAFEECELDFGRFMLAIKRHGVFMYTFNHPKPDVLVELAKLIAVKLGAPQSVFDREIVIRDALTDYVWPIYPEVADELCLPHGSYDWKLGNEWFPGVERFLEYVFGEYAKRDCPREALQWENRDEGLHDRVLGAQLRALA